MPEFTTPHGVITYARRIPEDGQGRAETVVLLHNFMSTGRMAWGNIADDLVAAGYRVLLPDLPGHGQSVGYPSAFEHRVMAAQLAALVRAEGVRAPHLAGCSSGGMLALWMVHDRHIAPATLTLVSATYSVNPATTGVTTGLHPENFRAGRAWLDASARLHDIHQGDGYFDRVLLPAFRGLTPASAIDLGLAALHTMSMPAAVIHGDEDEVFPIEVARQMAGALPNGELTVVRGQSHALIFRQPWKVSELLRDFLARNPVEAAVRG
jgi:pimeloyl-ACP methyl ester carboxylesterase